jgi:glutamine cyclotransferase
MAEARAAESTERSRRSLAYFQGSDSLLFISPTTFQVQQVIRVRYRGAPLYQLNEL